VANNTIPYLIFKKIFITSLYTTSEAYTGRVVRCVRHENGTLKADSHIAFSAHAAPMLFPCHAVPLRV